MTVRRRQSCFAATLVVVIQLPVYGAFGQDFSKTAICELLGKSYVQLRDISGSFETTQTPTDTYVDAYSRDTNSKGSRAEVRNQLSQRMDISFALKKEGGTFRFLEAAVWGLDGTRRNRMIFACDGKDHFWLSGIPDRHEAKVATVVINQNIIEEFASYLSFGPLLNLGGPADPRPFIATLQDHGEASARKIAVGSESLCEIAANMNDDGGRKLRLIATLDPARAMFARRLDFGWWHTDRKAWQSLEIHEALEIVESSSPSARCWYPKRFVRRMFTPDGVHSFTVAGTMRAFACNTDPPIERFRPSIENGSNVIDRKTNKTFVWGNRPSERVLAAIREKLDETRKTLPDQPPLNHRTSPSSMFADQATSWIVLLVGLSCLVVAATLRMRQVKSRGS